MSDYVDIVEHNPIVFVKKVCEALSEGYTVTTSIEGYPSFSPYCQIRLFKVEQSGVVVPSAWADQVELRVEDYDGISFMLLLNAAVKGGWSFVEDGAHFFDERGLKSVQLTKKAVVVEPAKPVVAKVEATKPAKQNKQNKPATAKKALVAEPTITEMENIDDKQAE